MRYALRISNMQQNKLERKKIKNTGQTQTYTYIEINGLDSVQDITNEKQCYGITECYRCVRFIVKEKQS